MIDRLSITTIYDNIQYNENLGTGWGFSSLIKTDNDNILFDTGGDSQILLGNMEKLGIDSKLVNIIFLSHIHGDHTGSLKGFLEKNSEVKVYLPKSFPERFKNVIKSYDVEIVEVSSPMKIREGFYSTGDLGSFTKEQSLIVKTKKGVVIITGCAHSGIVSIIKKSKEVVDENIYLVMGGFHLKGYSKERIEFIIHNFRNLGVQKVAPSHCTGDQAINLFKNEYGDDFISNGTGKIIQI